MLVKCVFIIVLLVHLIPFWLSYTGGHVPRGMRLLSTGSYYSSNCYIWRAFYVRSLKSIKLAMLCYKLMSPRPTSQMGKVRHRTITQIVHVPASRSQSREKSMKSWIVLLHCKTVLVFWDMLSSSYKISFREEIPTSYISNISISLRVRVRLHLLFNWFPKRGV